VNREEYDAAVEAVDAGRYDPLIREVSFSLDDFHADPTGTNAKLLGVLHGA
jgi:urea carboxylase